MSIVSRFDSNPTAHTKDALTHQTVNNFLDALTARYADMVWYGLRISDSLKLQCLHEGLLIEISHFVPKGHPDFVEGCGVDVGKRKHEIMIKVKDISERFGRASPILERFDKGSSLFSKAEELFQHVWRHATVSESRRAVNRLSYPSAVMGVTKLL